MALTIDATRRKGSIGSHMLTVFEVTADGTDGGFHTGMGRVEFCDFITVKGGTDNVVDVYINSASASAVENDPGHIFLDGLTDTHPAIIMVMGR